MKITQFATIVGARLIVTYNAKLHGGSWQAKFENCEVIQNESFLLGE